MSNYSDLIGFTIFKCGSGYYAKPQMIVCKSFEVFVLPVASATYPHLLQYCSLILKLHASFRTIMHALTIIRKINTYLAGN